MKITRRKLVKPIYTMCIFIISLLLSQHIPAQTPHKGVTSSAGPPPRPSQRHRNAHGRSSSPGGRRNGNGTASCRFLFGSNARLVRQSFLAGVVATGGGVNGGGGVETHARPERAFAVSLAMETPHVPRRVSPGPFRKRLGRRRWRRPGQNTLLRFVVEWRPLCNTTSSQTDGKGRVAFVLLGSILSENCVRGSYKGIEAYTVLCLKPAIQVSSTRTTGRSLAAPQVGGSRHETETTSAAGKRPLLLLPALLVLPDCRLVLHQLSDHPGERSRGIPSRTHTATKVGRCSSRTRLRRGGARSFPR